MKKKHELPTGQKKDAPGRPLMYPHVLSGAPRTVWAEVELEEAWRARRSGGWGPRVGRGWTCEKGKFGAVFEGRRGRSEAGVGVRRAARAASVRGRRREGIVGEVWGGRGLFSAAKV